MHLGNEYVVVAGVADHPDDDHVTSLTACAHPSGQPPALVVWSSARASAAWQGSHAPGRWAHFGATRAWHAAHSAHAPADLAEQWRQVGHPYRTATQWSQPSKHTCSGAGGAATVDRLPPPPHAAEQRSTTSL